MFRQRPQLLSSPEGTAKWCTGSFELQIAAAVSIHCIGGELRVGEPYDLINAPGAVPDKRLEHDTNSGSCNAIAGMMDAIETVRACDHRRQAHLIVRQCMWGLLVGLAEKSLGTSFRNDLSTLISSWQDTVTIGEIHPS
jgi:hypothetical protein